MRRRMVGMVLRLLDSRWLSRLRAVVFLGTTGVAVLLVAVGLFLAVLRELTHVGAVPLVFIGLGILVLLAGGVGRARELRAQGKAKAVEASTVSDDDLKARMRQLSTDIYEMLAERAADGPARIGEWHGHQLGDKTDVQRARDSQRFMEQTLRHSLGTMSRYRVRYEAQALVLFDEAAKRGWADPSERPWFEHPTNPLGVEHCARALGVIGGRL